MKKVTLYILIVCFFFFIIGCDEKHTHKYYNGNCECGEKDPNYVPPHVHEFVDGVCECGEKDPNYVPPHVHEFVDGVCECGEKDPNYVPPHVHEFVDGVCECGEKDPNYVPPHVHEFVDGVCECGEKDPNYVPPHVHEFVDGVCECGEKDPNYVPPHVHEFVDGECVCGEKDPNYVPPHVHEFVDGVCECGEKDPNYVPPHVHEFIDGICECGEKDPNYVVIVYTEGLEYILSDDGSYYIVVGKGDSTDKDIYIPPYHENIPVKEIGNSAFASLSSVNLIVIPEGITKIGRSAFSACNADKIVLADSIETVGNDAFTNTRGLEYFTENNIVYVSSRSNPYFMVSRVDNKEQEYYSINDKTKFIDDFAFDGCTNLMEIEIPSSVIGIGSYAFFNCSQLKKIRIPENVTVLADCVFAYCTNLTDVNIHNNITSIGRSAFSHCINLTNIVIPDSVTSIGELAFFDCTGLQNVTLPNTIDIFEDLFGNYKQIKSIYYNGTLEEWCQISDFIGNPMSSCAELYMLNEDNEYYTLVDVVIPDSITILKDNVFTGCKTMKNVYFHEKVEYIGVAAFSGCTGLKSIFIPNSIKVIKELAFVVNSDLTIYCEAMSKPVNWSSRWNESSNPVIWGYYEKNGIGYIKNTDGKYKVYNRRHPDCIDVEIPSSVDGNIVSEIGYRCFEYSTLRSIKIPNTIVKMDSDAFYRCDNLSDVYYDGTISDWLNIEFNNGSANPLSYAQHFYLKNDNNEYYEIGSSVVFPDSITNICEYAFFGFSSLKSIEFSNNIVRIGRDAFKNCEYLESIYYDGQIEDWCNISFQNSFSNPLFYTEHFYVKNSFNEYYEIEDTIVISNNTSIINDYAFSNFGKIKYLEIADGIEYIGANAFSNFKELENLIIPNTVIEIGSYAFYGCESLETVQLSNSLTMISESMFSECINLVTIHIPNSIEIIDFRAFENCLKLTSIIIPKTVKEVSHYAFKNCPDLIIYCEASNKPTKWSDKWNIDNNSVIWGFENN